MTDNWRTIPTKAGVLAAHAALLHTGKIIYFSGNEYDQSRHDQGDFDHTRLFDCDTLRVTRAASPGTDVFCCGHALLEDGRLLVAGGTEAFPFEVEGMHHIHFPGLRDAWLFSAGSEEWVKAADMNFQPGRLRTGGGRWYPTLVTLGTGEVAAMSGHPSADDTRASHDNQSPETFSQSPLPAGSWTQRGPNQDEIRTKSYYPRLHVLPDGQVFSSTPLLSNMNASWSPISQQWHPVCEEPPDGLYQNGYGASSVMLPLLADQGYRPRILWLGAAQPRILDLSDSNPEWVPTAPRTLDGTPERQNVNAVLLPTGEVFVCGGIEATFDADGNYQSLDADAVLAAECYKPATDQWVTLPAAQVARNYHSVALLMPDGRVWTAGSSIDAARGAEHAQQQIEIYEPAYYRETRPEVIGPLPTAVNYGATFALFSPQASTVTEVVMVRAGSVTHSFNSDQRLVGIDFHRRDNLRLGAQELLITAPPDGSIAPPGYYLLFLLNEHKIPSLGHFVQVGYQSTRYNTASTPAVLDVLLGL